MSTDVSGSRWRITSAILVAAIVVTLWFAMPRTRQISQHFLDSLRMQPVQAVNVNLSNFTGPNANPTLQQMFTEMISKQVTTTASEDPQPASSAAEAAKLTG